ncbi:peptidyl-prolyl cis-trans isomerase C [Sedimentibacter acidaminivorans]|jgi:peptidyl-prolyl cis-trans isomerase C|uniref:Peptidyl-prolyl cis-trans isomerase C n=1 Tax=Sedimentibacter acidaminivorans TaxID=913099 RepID=A0ABS4GE77_9FIRM|nr:peptidylprolyl isomerase [Sedimentibacter acidaminivorans]MBP1925665.1 peptidyl-prolyl cis-trans isomerase C [Sedimentibacter acidaminivorans]
MDNKLIAVVDGREVRESDFRLLMNNLGQNAQYFQGEEGRKKLIEELVMHELVYSDSIENGLDKDEEFIKALDTMKKSMLQQYGLSKMLNKVTVSDEEIEEYYEKNKHLFKTNEMVKASHILVDTEEKANEVLEDLTDGLSFEEAAQQYSSCPSKTAGGDLGQFGRGQMVKEFEDAAFAMKKGEISDPVKTQFGYHIIKLIDHVPARDSELEEVKEDIRKNCVMAKQDKVYINKKEELKNKYKIEVFE